MLLLSGIPLPTLIPANQNMSRESIITWFNRPFKNHNSLNYNHILEILKFHAYLRDGVIVRNYLKGMFIIVLLPAIHI
jgi:hypothetical protein